MNMLSQIAAAKTTGLSFREPRVDPVKRQEEIAEILKIANQARSGLSRLSKFSVAPARHDDAYSYFAQIRASTRSGFGGAEFRFDIPARDTGKYEPQDIAADLLAAARRFNRLTGLAPYAKLVRSVIENTIEPATDKLVPMRLIAFGISMSAHGGDFEMAVDFEMLGDDLTIGIDRVTDRGIDRLEVKLAEQVATHIAREKLWIDAAASRACGWIDDIARRILDASGMSCSEVVSRLRKSRDLEFYLRRNDGHNVSACLNWQDGVIRGHFRPLANDCDFGADLLTVLREKVSEADIASLPGRRFYDLFEQPFIPADALITSACTAGDWLYVKVAVGMSLIDEAAGNCRVARCPA